jgi:hypothetical protein
MRTDRKIVLFTGVAVVFALALPAFAAAGSLLSGYGGPGQGSQQLLGSTLIGASSGGGGSGGGSGTSEGTGTSSGGGSLGSGAGFSSSGEPARAGSPDEARSRSGVSGTGAAGGGAGEGGGHGAGGRESGQGSYAPAEASDATVIVYPSPSVERAYLAGAGSGSAGWANGLLPYVLLALVVVAFTGWLTRRLAIKKGSEEPRSLKGWVAGPE